MKHALIATFMVLLGCATANCQQQPSPPATKQDVEQLLTVTGARVRVQQLWTEMGEQIAVTVAESFRLKHPDATPMQVHKVSQIASKSYQSSLSVISLDELINAIIPIYQKHLTHDDVQGILAFYNSPAGKKYLKEQSAMQLESMQAVQPIIKKHLPEMQAAADKAVQRAMYPSAVSSREGNAIGK